MFAQLKTCSPSFTARESTYKSENHSAWGEGRNELQLLARSPPLEGAHEQLRRDFALQTRGAAENTF